VVNITEARRHRTTSSPDSPQRLDNGQRAGSAKTHAGHLRRLLVAVDLIGSLLGWFVVLAVMNHGPWQAKMARALPEAAALSALMILLLTVQKLYLARVCTVRALEVARVARAAALCGLAAVALRRVIGGGPTLSEAAAGAVSSFVAITYLRGQYSSWLRACRARGLSCRSVCVLGDNDEAEALVHLLAEQPELGYRVIAVLGDPAKWASRRLDVPIVELEPQPADTVRALGACGVIVAVSSVASQDLDRIVRQLVARDLHVQISSGLARIGHHRIRVSPLCHQVLFYVEPPRLSSWQFALKRAIDVILTSLGLVLSAPVLAVAAIAIKLDDGGPVFYRQWRVGRNGHLFEVLKLRTMVPDASAQLAGLVGSNERDGPLFKLSVDPRVTRVGRFLRATSLDELPQLVNVLRGQMSLVGPRPALPSEVAQFDPDLLERTSVPAGITGLWQIEARDDPSFDAYRRLDLFYVDNWSVTMDLAILVATVGVVVARGIRAVRGGGEVVRPAPRPNLDPASAYIAAALPPLEAPGAYSG
jgi:exopolysaccharide biosynthesis polyprenyl glycosylphosphotransferase